MTDKTEDNGEVRDATPGDYLVSRSEDGELEPLTVEVKGKRHVCKPFTYREASEYYGNGEGVQELNDDKAVEILKEKFVVPDLSGMDGPEDMKPSAVIELLSVLHEASQINVDIEDGDGYKRVDFAEDEKKTG